MSVPHRLFLLTLCWCAATGLAPAAALGYSFGSLVTPLGPEEMVFDGPGTCPSPPEADPPVPHVVDGPARAFRDARGRVQMMLQPSRRLIGPSLDALSPDCQIVHMMEGTGTPPSSYTNGDWVTSPYRMPDGTVIALLHNEYHGLLTDPPDCSEGSGDQDCWMSSITAATSTDDGETYVHQPAPPGHLIAALPYPYEPDWGAQGYQNPSNVLLNQHDGYLYAMFYVRADPQTAPGQFRDQEVGECLMRSATGDPASWRAWDGTSFSTQFINPYAPGYDPVADPPNHVCKPVSTTTARLRRTFVVRNLTYSSFFNKFLIVGQQNRNGVRGFWYSLSDDLVSWSTPRLMMTTVVQGDCTTADRAGAYPAILDAADTTVNFDRPGREVDLYWVKLNWCGPSPNLDRDRVRVPIRFERPLRWATGAADTCPGGFDAQVTSASATFALDQARDYTGAPASYRSDASAGGGYAYGVFDREDYPAGCAESDPTVRPTFKYSAGNDIWYSAAFLLPGDGFWNRLRGDVTLMRLDNQPTAGPATGPAAGVLAVGADDRLHFRTDPSGAAGDEVEILKSGSANGVPLPDDDCWHFVEVHQRLGDTGAVNELWLDGVQQDTVSGADNFHGAPYDRLRAGIVSSGAGGSGSLTAFTDLVGYGYGGPLSHIRCNGLSSGAPAALRTAAPAEAALRVLSAPAGATSTRTERRTRARRARKSRPGASVRFRARERLRPTAPRGGWRGRADRGAAAQAR